MSAITCDRCPQHARTEWWHDQLDRSLTFCSHCSNERADALVASGWVLLFDLRVEETATAPTPLPQR